MKLSENIMAKIAEIFKSVEYGRIIFYLSPENKNLEYIIENRERIPLDQKTLDKH